MRANNICLIVFIMLLFCGCQQTDMGDDSVLLNESGVDLPEELYCEKETQSSLTDETEESVESIETADITEEDVYEIAQKMIEELDQDFFVKPEEFGKTMYTDDKFEEIKQYEMNIVLDYLKLKHWNSPVGSADEVDLNLPVDAPLGEYTIEKLQEYTEEKHDLTVEYFCGACFPANPDKRFIALVIKEYEKGIVQTIYYQIINYGYMGVMTGDNSYYYDANGSLEDIKINKIEEGDVDHYINSWIDEEEDEINMIFDIGKEERQHQYGTYTSYEQSIWVICKKGQEGYTVKEIIPMRLRE